jgi:hypothetical protein
VAQRGFFNGDGTPMNHSGRRQVLQLQEGEEEVRGKIDRTEKPQRDHSPERGCCGYVRFQNRQGCGSSVTKVGQEDKGEGGSVARALERRIWALEGGHWRPPILLSGVAARPSKTGERGSLTCGAPTKVLVCVGQTAFNRFQINLN